ncbi:hypothetical protein G9A89_005184 [Geosiphon pyriformis]|nr:hypothetical protein G9A89_005184 [Geosiphon pyriformis]
MREIQTPSNTIHHTNTSNKIKNFFLSFVQNSRKRTTIGSVIAVIKKTIKASVSEGGFKAVVSRKKRKSDVLKESIDNKEVAAKALGAHSWSSETGDTMESESIDMEEECLVEKTSVDYDDNGTFAEGDPNQTPKGLCVKTKKVLGKPLGVIDYDTVDAEDNVLDDSLFLPPLLPAKLSVQVSVCKSFALNIDLIMIARKFSHEKVNLVRKIFSGVNGFGGASTPSKFGEIIWVSFTFEKMMMAAAQLANNCSVVINTNLKRPINNRMNWAIVLKEIPVKTSIEAVHAAISEFGIIKSIKMQLVGLWQKVIIELEDQIQADLLAAEWSIFIGKDTMHVAWANVDKQMWDARDEFRALLYTLPMGTNAHDFWDFIGSVGGKTCVIEHTHCATMWFNSEGSLIQTMTNTPVIKGVGLRWSCLTAALCSICKTSSHTSLACCTAGVSSSSRSKRAPLSTQNQFHLAKIYEKKSASVSCHLAFSGKTWAFVVGKPLPIVSFGGSAQFSSISYGKPLPTVNGELEDCLKNIESSLVSLIGQIGELAKRLDSFMPAVFQPSPGCQLPVTFPSQNQGEDIVIRVGSGNVTSDKTAAVLGSTVSPEVVKLENMLEDLSASVMSLSVCLDGLALAGNDVICWHKDIDNLVYIFMNCPWLADKFDGVRVFTSGLDSGSLGARVLIIMNSSLAKHVCKISKMPGQLLSIKLLFKNKLLGSILGLYACASSVTQFSQAGKINSLIAKAINEFSFVILGGDFNEDGSHKCASFKKCFDLGLINSLRRSSFVKSPTWCNSRVVDHGMDSVEEYFDTNHKAVYVSVRLGGLLDLEFRNVIAANAVMFSDEFVVAEQFSDLDVIVLSASRTFKKKWFRGFDCVFNKVSSQFYKLELFVSKLAKASQLDSVGTLPVRFLFLSGASFDVIHSGLAKTRKSYHSSKLLESKHAEESSIRQAIEKRMESFKINKGHTIRSVLECPFHKVVLDHLVDGRELVLESELVKSKVNEIMESWTRKSRQFLPLDHVFNSAFSDIIHSVGFNEMFGVISNLPDGKAAGLSGIPNELWKHCDKLVLDMLLVLLNFCLDCESEGVLTNTYLIALIETARKVLSKILSDQISLACSTFDVLCRDNFFVLKGTSIQSPIFAIGLVIEDAFLIRIKMCDKFIKFFGSIHNGCTNRVMTDFGLTNRYHVHNRLDQEKIFSPLLWCIFYDSLLCEVKRQKSICGYRLISHFISKTGQVESQAGLTSFLATGAFVDDTIWISSSQAAIQHIFNVASEFFHLNNISINNDKTVAILINCRVTVPYLTISGMPISIAKRDESHCYLSIFLSSDGLSKPSLVKAHSNVWFFVNLILKKVISDKQFAYLVSSVLFSIVSYRTQFSFIPLSVCNKWDTLICKGLKSKFGLSLNFPNNALHHPFFKSASVIAFANSVGVLGHLFSYRSHDLQVLSWRLCHPLLFPVHIRVSPSNNFLAGCSIPMSLVLSETIFSKCVFSLKCYSIAFIEQLFLSWFDLSVCFLGSIASPSNCFSYEGVGGSSDIHQSLGFGVICNDLLSAGATRLSVYTDRSLSNLGTVDMLAGAAVFFKDIDSGLDVGVSGLAIALALKCVLSFHSVNLFLNSQVVINACRSESLSAGPDFRNCCWIEHYHIANVIHRKNLDVNWIKIKDHSDVLDNKRADVLAKNAALSVWHLPHLVSERFLKAGVNIVSGNSRHFVCDVFRSIHRAYWEVDSGSRVVPDCLCANIDWLRSSLVWHLDSHMATGFTSIRMAGFHTYFMKALYHHFPVAVRKCLYDRSYLSIVCLFCDEVEVSDHVFSCFSDTDSHANLLDTYVAAWEVRSGLSRFFLCILQLLSTCISDVTVSMALCKGFVFGNWYQESVSVYKDPKVAVVNIVNFVCEFCLAFRDNIWLVYVKHRAIMEKNKLIPCDDFIPVTVSGFSTWLSAEVIRLLGVADALGINFEYHKCCLFYAGVDNMASVHISV